MLRHSKYRFIVIGWVHVQELDYKNLRWSETNMEKNSLLDVVIRSTNLLIFLANRTDRGDTIRRNIGLSARFVSCE